MEFITETNNGVLKDGGRLLLRYSIVRIVVRNDNDLNVFFDTVYNNLIGWIENDLKKKLTKEAAGKDRRSRLYEKIPLYRLSISILTVSDKYSNVTIKSALDGKTSERTVVIANDGIIESPETFCGKKARRYKNRDFYLENDKITVKCKGRKIKIPLKKAFDED